MVTVITLRVRQKGLRLIFASALPWCLQFYFGQTLRRLNAKMKSGSKIFHLRLSVCYYYILCGGLCYGRKHLPAAKYDKIVDKQKILC